MFARYGPDVWSLASTNSVTEQPATRKHHRHAQGIRSGDDLLVTDGPSGLHDQAGAGFSGLFDAVREGKKRV